MDCKITNMDIDNSDMDIKPVVNSLPTIKEEPKLENAEMEMYSESDIQEIAPNLSVLVGPKIAAQLVGKVGSIERISEIKDSLYIGSKMQRGIASRSNVPPGYGFIYHCDIIQQIPADAVSVSKKNVREIAIRILKLKTRIAALADIDSNHRDGSVGLDIRSKLEAIIAKELAPPPVKAARPLPKPIDKPGKKRGGKRFRRQKAKYLAVAEAMKAKRIHLADICEDTFQDGMTKRVALSKEARRAL